MAERVRMPRSLKIAIFVTILGIFLIVYRSISGYEVLYVTVPQLNIYARPSKTAESVHRLHKGDQVFYQGKSKDQEGYRWIKVVHLFIPENANLDEARVGWIPGQSLDGRKFLKGESGFLKRNVAIRDLFKWKVRATARSWIRSSPPLQLIAHRNPYHVDKVFHILVAMCLSATLFFAFLIVYGSKWPALFTALLVSNAIGIFNELMDLRSRTAQFELRDIYANVIGSVLMLFLLLLCWSALEKIYTYHRVHSKE